METTQLIKFIQKKCTPEEIQEVCEWINADKNNKAVFQELQIIWTAVEISQAAALEKPDKQSVQKIMNIIQIRKKARIYRRILLPFSIAAAILLFLYLNIFAPEPVQKIDYQSALTQSEQTDNIEITLQNGEKISLSDTSAVINYGDKGELIINDDTIKTAPSAEPILHTIHVPYGKLSKIHLIDGTIVHLNSGSSFIYPSAFTGNKREVFLDGEAFFDVKKVDNMKFIVETSYKSIEVLGTRFNVNTDKELEQFETVLVSGSIVVNGEKNKVKLAPSQLYKFSAGSKTEELLTVDTYKYIAWIDGRMYLERESLSNVIRKLEKVYNVKIRLLDNSLLSHTISGDLNLKDSPEETMNVVMKLLIPEYSNQSQSLYQLL